MDEILPWSRLSHGQNDIRFCHSETNCFLGLRRVSNLIWMRFFRGQDWAMVRMTYISVTLRPTAFLAYEESQTLFCHADLASWTFLEASIPYYYFSYSLMLFAVLRRRLLTFFA